MIAAVPLVTGTTPPVVFGPGAIVRVRPPVVSVVTAVGRGRLSKVWVPTITSPPGPPTTYVVPALTTVEGELPIVIVREPIIIASVEVGGATGIVNVSVPMVIV